MCQSFDDETLPNHSKDQYLELPLNKKTKDNMDYSMDMVERKGCKRIDSALKQSSSKKRAGLNGKKARSIIKPTNLCMIWMASHGNRI